MSNAIKIEAGRTYPYGTHGREVHVLRIEAPATSFADARAICLTTPIFKADQEVMSVPVRQMEAVVRISAEAKKRSAENRLKVIEKEGDRFGAKPLHERDLAQMAALLAGESIEPVSPFEEVRFNPIVHPSEAYEGTDFWSHVDAITGGCCTTCCTLPDGRKVFEAHVYGVSQLQAFLADPYVGELVALDTNLPGDLRSRADFPEALRELEGRVISSDTFWEMRQSATELSAAGPSM